MENAGVAGDGNLGSRGAFDQEMIVIEDEDEDDEDEVMAESEESKNPVLKGKDKNKPTQQKQID